LNHLHFPANLDIPPVLVHFVRRIGNHHADVPESIKQQSAMQRLANILVDRCILGFRQFGANDGRRMVCFSACSPAGARALVKQDRYEGVGLAFKKDFAFQEWGAGPALNIRGDEMRDLPEPFRERTVRYWPGTIWEGSHSFELADPDLDNPSEWMYESEWRGRATGAVPGCRFQLKDVQFLFGPENGEFTLEKCVGREQKDVRNWLLAADWKVLDEFDLCRGNMW
jgi:hypothetical protein